ncbi:tetratricopeptide repeat protein, partial [Elusimicrobiota bacterium]
MRRSDDIPPLLQKALPAALLIAAIGLLAWTLLFSRASPGGQPLRYTHTIFHDLGQHVEVGECLLHGVGGRHAAVSGRMPLDGLINGLVYGHGDPLAWSLWRLLTIVLQSALVLALGALCGLELAALGGLILLLAFVFLASADAGIWAYGDSAYSLLISLTACAMVWRAEKPSPSRSLTLGATIGVSLLFRSPLALLPPVLLLADSFPGRGGGKPPSWRSRLLLLGVPYAFLLPTLYMNWRLHGRFMPIESPGGGGNVVAAALGLAGPLYDYSADPDIAFLIREVGLHPLRYAVGFLTRVLKLFSYQPVLFTLAGVSLWVLRRDKRFRALALFTGYFILVHCLIMSLRSYMIPLWAPLAVLAAPAIPLILTGGLASARPEAVLKARASGREAATALCGILLIILLPLSVYSMALAVAYPSRVLSAPTDETLLDRAILSSPRDAWLKIRRARLLTAAGKPGSALEDYAQARRLRPWNPLWALESAWARALAG